MLEQLLVSSAPAAKPDHLLIPNTQFITGSGLTTLLSSFDAQAGKGLLMPQADTTPWVLLRADGKVFMIPQKPLRYNVTRAAINAGGIRTGVNVTIAGCVWLVRLFRGANNATSEWNKYMYGITVGNLNPPIRYASYNYDELGLTEVGSLALTTHVYETGSGTFYVRGNSGNIGYIDALNTTSSFNSTGWRPILEYVSGELPW